MLSKDEIQSISKDYNISNIGISRQKYLKKILPSLHRKEILILKGIRRCGKSTILKQMMQHLIDNGIKKKNILYVSLDDYRFLEYRGFELLNKILDIVKGKEKSYLFLDEIQVIPQFESWLKTQYDTEINVKFIISGSGSGVLSKELGTLLTGRNLTFEIFPLDYNEYKDFNKGAFEEFLTYGGFPEVVLANSNEEKIQLLQNYMTNIIEKDVMIKRSIRDPKQIEKLIHFIMSNPGIRVSLNKLSKQLDINIVTLQKYLGYFIDAYLVFEVPFFSYSAKSKFIASNIPKYYVLDNGFYLVNSARKEESKQVEAVVAQKLFRDSRELFYWKGGNEVDFVADDIAYNVVSSKKIPEREYVGFIEIKTKFKNITKCVILSPVLDTLKDDIQFLEIKQFLTD